MPNEKAVTTIFYRGRKVGTLVKGKNNLCSFAYEDSWLKEGFPISPFFLPLEHGIFTQVETKGFMGGLFGVFYDSLPDTWGNHLLDKWLAKNGHDPYKFGPFERLCLLDSNTLGALTYRPLLDATSSEEDQDIQTLATRAKEFWENDEVSEDAFLSLYHAGSSAGGSRPKANIMRSGKLWLAKFPMPRHDSPLIGEMEYDYNLAAQEAGIKVPEFALLKVQNGESYFASMRFDRDGEGKPIHMISLAGLLEINIAYPVVDYLTLLQTCRVLCPEDVEMAYRLMCFNIFAKNKDDHARNFAFLYDEKTKRYRLAPAFDLTYTPKILEHATSVNWKGNPTREDMFLVGEKVGISREDQKTIQTQIEQIVNARLSKYWE